MEGGPHPNIPPHCINMNAATLICLFVACLWSAVFARPAVMLDAAGTSYVTTRNTTTYNAAKAEYCDAGFCGKTGRPQNGCPWAQPHCPAGWTTVDVSNYEETSGCAGQDAIDMQCVATCVTSTVCGSP